MSGSAPAITRQSLVETLQSFKRTSLLRAAFELKVFDALADGPHGAAAIAAAIGADQRAVGVFLGAAAAVGLLESDGVEFALPEGGERFLVSTSREYAGHAARVNVSDWEWDALRDLAGVVRQGGATISPDACAPGFPFWEIFAEQGTFVTRAAAEGMLDALEPWASGRPGARVVDIGCGHALFGLAFAQRYPNSSLVGLDWPNVLPLARKHAERIGVAERVELIEGDAFTVRLPGTYDLVILANLLPMFSERRGTDLLRRLARSLRPDARLALVAFTVGERPPADEHAAHMLSLLMLALTREGKAHPVAAYRRMLAAAGFSAPSVHRVADLPVHVLVAGRARRSPRATS